MPAVPSSGCLDRFGETEPGFSPNVLPAGAEVPRAEDDPAIRQRILDNGHTTDSTIRLTRGFVDGEEIAFWNFGPAPTFVTPVWLFFRCDDEGMPLPGEEGMAGHPGIVDSLPGDSTYTPWWSVEMICVTDTWNGEQITSAAAIRDAVELGLILEPRPIKMYANCPVVFSDVVREVGNGEPPASPNAGFANGLAVYYHLPGGEARGVLPFESPRLPIANVYLVRRERTNQVVDTIFERRRRDGDETADGYTPVVRQVNVFVSSEYTQGDARSEANLFIRNGDNLVPLLAAITRFEVTETILNYDMQFAPGVP